MTISPRLKSYLARRQISFDEVPHEKEMHVNRAARAADLDVDQVAKAVVVRTGDEYMLAVIPSSRQVSLNDLEKWLGRDVRLADELEIGPLFSDCSLGAIPPVGDAYGLETVLDAQLVDRGDIYFEGGDHRTFIHVDAGDWRRLMKDAAHGAFCS